MLKVSDHIAAYEVADKWTREVRLSPYIVRLFEAVRREVGKPILITSGYRTQVYQNHLRSIGFPAAEISPHVWGAALDMLFPQGMNKEDLILLFRTKSVELGYDVCRLGYKKYLWDFLHCDVVYLLCEPHTSVPNPKPELWKPGVSW